MSDAATAPADDLHKLIALASLVQPACDEERRFSDLTSPHPTFLPESLAKHSPNLGKRVTHTLDALALLCVNRARADVFAVAAQIVHDPVVTCHEGEVVLTIAWNAGVPKETVKHISDLWRYMTEIAHYTHGQIPVAADFGGESPPYEPAERDARWMEYHRRLALDVYQFSFSKFYRRLR